jgi:hypothetical protein
VKPLAVEHCQDLWKRHLDQTASLTDGRFGVVIVSLALDALAKSDDAPARTRAARCEGLTAAKQVS